MSEVTLTLDEEATKWAQERADKHEVSLAQYIADMIRAEMFVWRTYSDAQRQYFDIKPRNLNDGKPYPSRDQLYDRKVLR